MEATELQRLASMGNALRPDWPARSLLSFLSKHYEARAYGDVAVALAWVATRTKTETPRLLLEAGPWWKAAAIDTAHVQRPPRKHEECPLHAGHWRESCHGCAADRLAGERTTPAEPRRPERSNEAAMCRAQLAQVVANLCPHLVDRRKTRCAECERPVKSETDAEEAEK